MIYYNIGFMLLILTLMLNALRNPEISNKLDMSELINSLFDYEPDSFYQTTSRLNDFT